MVSCEASRAIVDPTLTGVGRTPNSLAFCAFRRALGCAHCGDTIASDMAILIPSPVPSCQWMKDVSVMIISESVLHLSERQLG